MVKTWEAAWFGEEGLRLLYIVPRSLTEEVLPLRICPQPTERVRVLVGRHDFLTPEREQEIDRLLQRLENKPPDAERTAIEQELSKLGRFRNAASGMVERKRTAAITAK